MKWNAYMGSYMGSQGRKNVALIELEYENRTIYLLLIKKGSSEAVIFCDATFSN